MSEIDRQIEAAWRATSREQPPAEVDDAIRAAARRAVHAGPTKKRTTSWWRAKTHWVPLAAAAVMAVFAVGLIQLTPPEQVNPALIADRWGSPRPMEEDTRKPVAAEPSRTTAETPRRDAQSSADQLANERAAEIANKQRAQLATQRSASGAEKRRAAASSPEAPRQNDERQRVASLDAGAPARSKVEAAGTAAAGSAPGEPFPAAQAPAGRSQPSSAASSPTLRNEPAAPPAAGSAATPQGQPFPAAEQSRAMSNASAPAPPAAMREGVPQVAGELDTPSEKAQPTQVGLAKVTDLPRSKDSSARAVDEWIKLIRRLRDEGKSLEAAKELAAFRGVYKERADELLPPDLREPKR
jgi:hypothetical protein